MPRFLKIVLSVVAGLIVGEAIPLIGYIIATSFFGLFDRDGGGAMGAIFILGPICAFVCAVAAGLWASRKA